MYGLDYVLNLVDNSFSSVIRNAKKETNGLDNAIHNTNKSSNILANTSKRSFENASKITSKATKKNISFGNSINDIQKKNQGLSSSINNTKKNTNGLNTIFKRTYSLAEKIGTTSKKSFYAIVQGAINATNKNLYLNKSIDGNKTNITNLNSSIKRTNKSSAKLGKTSLRSFYNMLKGSKKSKVSIGSLDTTIQNANKNTDKLNRSIRGTDNNTRRLNGASKQGFGSIVTWAKRAAVATGLVFGINQAVAFGNEVTNVTAKFEGYENAIKFASGKEGATNLSFLNKTIKDLNLDLDSSFSGFQTLAGSLKGTSLEGKATRDIFEGVGIAATVMNLSADQSKGAFLALSQMASKGKVQAEELRGQLGERIPGALAIASRAMGVNQATMNKMLDEGKVYAEDFLPKFATELKKTFGDGLPAAANSMQAAINTKNNALVSFKKSFGDNMRPAIIETLKLKAKFFSFLDGMIPKLKPIFSSVINLAQAFSPLTDRLFGLGKAMGGTSGILDGLKSGIDTLAVGIEIAAEGIGWLIDVFKPVAPIIAGIVAAQWAWNIAMTANPIGLVVAGVAALAGTITYAYNKVGWFRGGIDAAWTTIKGFGNAIKEFVVDRIKQMISGITGIGQTLMHFFKGDWSKAWETGKAAVKNLTGIGVGNGKKFVANMKTTGIEAGKAYADGVAQAKLNATKKTTIFDAVSNTAKVPKPSTKGDPKFTAPGGLNKNKTPSASASVGGSGGGSKNITFKIESLVKQITIQPQTLKEGVHDIEKQIKDAFIRMVRDTELQID